MKLAAIAVNTFREAIRDKILYSLLFFAILMIGFSLVLGELSLGDYTKIIKDLGLASISLFGTLIAIFVGIGLVYKEIEQRTIYTILSKPISRRGFILGKFLGLALTLAVEVAIMSTVLLLVVWSVSGELQAKLLVAIGYTYLELLLITAFAILFSAFSTPTLAAIFSISIYLIGHLTQDIYTFGGKSESAMIRHVSEALYLVLPNLENLNFKSQMVHDVGIPMEQFGFSLVYGVVYTVLVLGLASVIFERRDFR